MTATMDNHTELIKLQNEMRKVIRCYSMLKLKDKDSQNVSDLVLFDRLNSFQIHFELLMKIVNLISFSLPTPHNRSRPAKD